MYFVNNIRSDKTKVLFQTARKASRKSDIDEMAFIQNYPMIKNDKMLTSSNTFSEFTSNITHTCRELLSKNNKHIFPEFISNITGLRELFPNNTKHFSRHQAILKFSESYCQTILHTFSELTSNNTDISRELLANNTTHFSRVYTKQY